MEKGEYIKKCLEFPIFICTLHYFGEPCVYFYKPENKCFHPNAKYKYGKRMDYKCPDKKYEDFIKQ